MQRGFFIAFLFFFSSSLHSAAQEKKAFVPARISMALAEQLYKNTFKDSIDLLIVLKPAQAATRTKTAYRVLAIHDEIQTIRIAVKNMAALLKDSNLVFADLVKKPKEELTTGALDLSVNSLNTAHARYPLITGNGILISIKEQQPDTTDIDYGGRYINTNAAAPTFSTHASIMATTMAGCGNTSPFATGAAPAAAVTATSFASLLPESDAYYKQNTISIQNHSYGTVPENYYGTEAMAYDKSATMAPTLLHIFSAGNSGTASGTGTYAGVQGWSNLTGNFKTAKNVLVVGAIDSFYQVAPASSKGPTFDGRVKPELVAFGEDGSSGAAALVSGTAALLQQAYLNQKQQLPSAAVLKAILLNSADDIDIPHIDYRSGYGSLNGYNAVKTIAENRFWEDTMQHGVLKKFALHLPRHTAQLKVTLAWTDKPAAVNAPKALVNDLNAVLKNTQTGEAWLPWVLNATAHIDSLQKEATRKRDTLNTAEQITIAAPPAGDYSLEISADTTIAAQAFAVAYQIDTMDYFEWNFPTATDAVLSGTANVLRWQTTDTGKATIEYTTGNETWKKVTDSIDLKQGYYTWNVPDTMTTARLRMHLATEQVILSDTFVISNATNVNVGFNCADSFLLYWNTLPVSQYQLYALGNQYLEPITTISDTAVIFQKRERPEMYYSIAPLIAGKPGLRSFTINYTTQGTGCYFKTFYLISQDAKQATFAASLGSLYNIAEVTLQKRNGTQFSNLKSITNPGVTDFNFTDSALVNGGNRYRLQIKLYNGIFIYSEEINVYNFGTDAIVLFPNPVIQNTPVTVLTNDNTIGHVRIEIYTATGALIHKVALNNIINAISTTALSKGVYIVHVIDDTGKRSSKKLVVY